MARRWMLSLGSCLATAVLCGCAVKVHKVQLDSSRLVGELDARVACAYRQGEVVDARPSTGRAGGLGKHLFLVQDASDIVRDRLAAVGIPAQGEGKAVDVRVLHMYMTQSHVTKIPVVVLAATVEGEPGFTVRSQKASMNWNGTEDEAYRGYSQAFDDAMGQMVVLLNGACHER